MACQALNSFTELLFAAEDNNNNGGATDVDIEVLRRQMDKGEVKEEVLPAKAIPAANANASAKNDRGSDIPEELTIFTVTPAPANTDNTGNATNSSSHNQAAEEAILACRSGDVADVKKANVEGINDDIEDIDDATVETSPLDVTQDTYISDSSLTGESAASSNGSYGSNGSSNSKTNSKSKTKSNSNSNSNSKSKSIGRSRSHMSSLHHLKANLSNKANQLRELDTLVSWQSRRTCKLSDPTASANYDESVEVTAVDITLANGRKRCKEDPPEQLEKVEDNGMDGGDDNAPEPASDLEPSPEQLEWSDNYSKLAAEYHQNGGSIAHITQSRTSKPNVEYYKMRMFVEKQRKAAKNGLLSKEQIVKLVAVGFDFGGSDNVCDGGDDENIDKEQNNNPANDNNIEQVEKNKQETEIETADNGEDKDDDLMKEISQCASF